MTEGRCVCLPQEQCRVQVPSPRKQLYDQPRGLVVRLSDY